MTMFLMVEVIKRLPMLAVVRISEIRFRANTIETVQIFNVLQEFNVGKPSVSKKDNMIVFRIKEICTKGNTRFNERRGISVRKRRIFKATKPNRNTLFTNTKRK